MGTETGPCHSCHLPGESTVDRCDTKRQRITCFCAGPTGRHRTSWAPVSTRDILGPCEYTGQRAVLGTAPGCSQSSRASARWRGCAHILWPRWRPCLPPTSIRSLHEQQGRLHAQACPAHLGLLVPSDARALESEERGGQRAAFSTAEPLQIPCTERWGCDEIQSGDGDSS